MRPLLVAMFILVCDAAAAQPSVSIGVGGGAGTGDCRDVARQIVRDWIDVRDLMGSDDGSLKRPSPNDFQCVAPTEIEGAMPRHVGASALRCYTVQRTAVCCDAQMRSCAGLSQ
jgi:hypothetical protein